MGNSGIDKERPLIPDGISRLEGQDLEGVVERIIRILRSGKAARLPGLGTINPGNEGTFLQERSSPAATSFPRKSGRVRDDKAK
jgi:hypothetical protein